MLLIEKKSAFNVHLSSTKLADGLTGVDKHGLGSDYLSQIKSTGKSFKPKKRTRKKPIHYGLRLDPCRIANGNLCSSPFYYYFIFFPWGRGGGLGAGGCVGGGACRVGGGGGGANASPPLIDHRDFEVLPLSSFYSHEFASNF